MNIPLKLFNSPTQQCSSLRLIIVIISFFLNPNSSSSCLSKSKNNTQLQWRKYHNIILCISERWLEATLAMTLRIYLLLAIGILKSVNR